MTTGKKRLLFLSRDQGSVQAILPVIASLSDEAKVELHVVSLAVSRSLLEERGIPSEPLDEADFARCPGACVGAMLDRLRPDLIVSGSSPARGTPPETPEQHVILEARRRHIPSLAVLDNWGMYAERFASMDGRPDPTLVPDRVCTLDTLCQEDLIAFGMPPERLVVTHNPWMDAVAQTAHCLPPIADVLEPGEWRVLFVSQPLAEMATVRAWPYNQEDVLVGLVDALPRPATGKQHRLLVWVHPAENQARWTNLSRFCHPGVEVVLARERGAAILGHVDLVVSSHSTVAYEALHYATPCVTFRPTGSNLPPLVTERTGLCRTFVHRSALRSFLQGMDPRKERARLRRLQQELSARQVFFNDGRATDRVVGEIAAMLAGNTKRTA